MAAAFPSACGKTNLAMMVSALEGQGYRVWTVGDDISWMKIGEDGYLRGDQSGSRIFWRGPRHGNENQSERNGSACTRTRYLRTVAMTSEREAVVGRNWQRGAGGTDQLEGERGTRPKERRRIRMRDTPCRQNSRQVFHRSGSARSVPIQRSILAGEEARVAPLVYESFDWQQRSVCWRHDGERDYRGGDRRRGHHAEGPDGHAALLRVQHGGLFWALAGDGEENTETAEDFSP